MRPAFPGRPSSSPSKACALRHNGAAQWTIVQADLANAQQADRVGCRVGCRVGRRVWRSPIPVARVESAAMTFIAAASRGPVRPPRQDADPMRSHPPVTDLVMRAADSDQQTSDALIERHAPLTWSICRRRQPSGADADDVGQSAWLQFVDQLDRGVR
jgi:hypothetical protein